LSDDSSGWKRDIISTRSLEGQTSSRVQELEPNERRRRRRRHGGGLLLLWVWMPFLLLFLRRNNN